jgi:Chaperone for flagella basal body P-ring formation
MKQLAVVLLSGVLAVGAVRCGAEVHERMVPGRIVPGRIMAQRAGGTKSCAEIASFVAEAASARGMPIAGSRSSEDLNCAAANSIPADAVLRLTKISWNAALRRWEFTLRCGRPGDCVPFLVWAHDDTSPLSRVAKVRSDGREDAKAVGSGPERLVAPGQTATLTWEQSGIRIVLPVTCLDAGGLGQFVRVRFKNAARTLRAEVIGKAMLRASL